MTKKKSSKSSTERTIRNIRRNSRKQYSGEEKNPRGPRRSEGRRNDCGTVSWSPVPVVCMRHAATPEPYPGGKALPTRETTPLLPLELDRLPFFAFQFSLLSPILDHFLSALGTVWFLW